jgi:uncharacterized SAM-binding protein YcdF (DUF218 family)
VIFPKWLYQRPRLALVRNLLVVVLGMVLAWVGPLYYRIAEASRQQELRRADVIIVFGAAEYSGHPSPTFKARLDHALDLYKQGLAPIVIVTGGSGLDTKFSEGGVGRDYLVEQGVPDTSIIAEMQSKDTHQSAERVANIMRANNMRTALAVSDGYHMFRVREMMTKEGIDVFAAPRPQTKPVSMMERILVNLRECLSYTLWKLHIT